MRLNVCNLADIAVKKCSSHYYQIMRRIVLFHADTAKRKC